MKIFLNVSESENFQSMFSWELTYICYVSIRVPCVLQYKVSAFLALREFKGNLQLMHGREKHHNGFFNIFSDITNFFHSFSVTDKQAYKLKFLNYDPTYSPQM